VSPVYKKWFAALCFVLIAAGIGYWFGIQKNTPAIPLGPSHSESTTMTTNRLALETSPYLRLHQHNPVDWYPWGTEAFEKARAEDKPIFLSVGYSSCYWCHVMERLVFSDLKIAKLMNDLFVNVKVDREERPDIDALYMTATQLISGSGGWPNSVFLTPDLKPFFAGTYFPPQDAHGRPGFPRVLEALHLAWQEKRQEVDDQSDQIAQAIRNIHASRPGATSWSRSDFSDKLQTHFQNRFDWQNGGMGGAPKFPPDQAIALFLEPGLNLPNAEDMVSLTLAKMAQGGIQDHLGGGFHRYSTDARWHVPHFEKMLYNQSMFAQSYLLAYLAAPHPSYRQTVEDIFRFVAATMTDPKGGFYSALDAETDAEEGAYYIWTEAQIRDILGSESDLFLEAFGLAPVPDAGAGALYRVTSDSTLALEKNIAVTEVFDRISRSKSHLLQNRSRRKFPLLDDKIITGWNGLMIAAYAQSARILDRPQDAVVAEKATHFILSNLRDASGSLYRVYHSEKRKIPAYQEDYAYLIHGLIELYRTTQKPTFLTEAEHLNQEMNTRFGDLVNGGYYFTPQDTELFVRAKHSSDGALPSGNAVALHNLCDLYEITGQSHYIDQANTLFSSFSTAAIESPEGYLHLIHGAMRIPQSMTQGRALQEPSPDQYVTAKLRIIASPDQPGAQLQAEIVVQIARNWHIQSARPSDEMLTATQLQIATRDTLAELEITYPEPQKMATAESTPDVYEGSLRIGLTCRVTPYQLAGAHLAFNLTYQACDDTRCLSPKTLTLPLDISF
jgi:uncharacterized protein YyaL (SSP411 family)